VCENESYVIDLDDHGSWPVELLHWVRAQAEPYRGEALKPGDLPLSLCELDDELRALVGERKLLAYHCTRLLEHEGDDVRERGLRLLTRELVNSRIARAVEVGAVPPADGGLRTNSVYALRHTAGRDGQVCFVVGRAVFDKDPSGCEPLLSRWGGEAIYWALFDEPDAPRQGRPSIVLARIDVADVFHTAPGLTATFVGAVLALDVWADVHVQVTVPPEDILRVWRPGDPQYDRHPELPRD
jgi:hypothetical protein